MTVEQLTRKSKENHSKGYSFEQLTVFSELTDSQRQDQERFERSAEIYMNGIRRDQSFHGSLMMDAAGASSSVREWLLKKRNTAKRSSVRLLTVDIRNMSLVNQFNDGGDTVLSNLMIRLNAIANHFGVSASTSLFRIQGDTFGLLYDEEEIPAKQLTSVIDAAAGGVSYKISSMDSAEIGLHHDIPEEAYSADEFSLLLEDLLTSGKPQSPKYYKGYLDNVKKATKSEHAVIRQNLLPESHAELHSLAVTMCKDIGLTRLIGSIGFLIHLSADQLTEFIGILNRRFTRPGFDGYVIPSYYMISQEVQDQFSDCIQVEPFGLKPINSVAGDAFGDFFLKKYREFVQRILNQERYKTLRPCIKVLEYRFKLAFCLEHSNIIQNTQLFEEFELELSSEFTIAFADHKFDVTTVASGTSLSQYSRDEHALIHKEHPCFKDMDQEITNSWFKTCIDKYFNELTGVLYYTRCNVYIDYEKHDYSGDPLNFMLHYFSNPEYRATQHQQKLKSFVEEEIYKIESNDIINSDNTNSYYNNLLKLQKLLN